MTTRGWASSVLVSFLLGCGGGGPQDPPSDGGSSTDAGVHEGVDAGTNPASRDSVTGTVNGRPVSVRSSAAQRFTGYSHLDARYEGLVVRLSEHTATCNPSGSTGLAAADKRLVTLVVRNENGAGPVTAGEWTGSLRVTLPDCTSSINNENPQILIDQASGVAVTLTELDGRVKGTFSGTLSSGAPISGSFESEYCNFYNWEAERVVCD